MVVSSAGRAQHKLVNPMSDAPRLGRGKKARSSSSSMCPSPPPAGPPALGVCSSARPGGPCSGAQLTAARLRLVGDQLQELTLRRRRNRLRRLSGGRRLRSYLRLLCAVTPIAALALLLRRRIL